VLWLLHAQADVPGVNFSDDFEVPVFRLTPSSASATEPAPIFPSDAPAETAPPAFQSDPTDVPAPANAKVAFTTGMDGSAEFYFRAFRNPSQVLTLFVFTAVWTGIVYFLGHSKLHCCSPWCSDWLTCCCSTDLFLRRCLGPHPGGKR